MASYRVSNNVFWVERDDRIQVIKTFDPKIYKLEGIAASVFLSIAKEEENTHPDVELVKRVISNLKDLEFIEEE